MYRTIKFGKVTRVEEGCVSRGQDTLPNPSGRAQALPKFWDTITYFDTEPGNFAQ